jgi:hypothetical protein
MKETGKMTLLFKYQFTVCVLLNLKSIATLIRVMTIAAM